MTARDRSRLSSLGGLARRRTKSVRSLTSRVYKSQRSAMMAGRKNTAMQKVRITQPHAYCSLALGAGPRDRWIVFSSGGILGEGKSPRSAWEAALTATLAKALET